MGYSNDQLELLVARFYGYKLFHVVLSAEPTDEVMEAVLGDDTLEAAEVLAALDARDRTQFAYDM